MLIYVALPLYCRNSVSQIDAQVWVSYSSLGRNPSIVCGCFIIIIPHELCFFDDYSRDINR